jgi:cbb3-type cytochrome oxidase subunit 3
VKLSDVMSAMRLEIYAEVALVLFLIAFFLVLVQILASKNKSGWQRARFLPLDDAASAKQVRRALPERLGKNGES